MRRGRGQIRSAVEVSVLSKLPKRGGLNAWVAESSFSMTTRAGSSSSVTTVRVSKAGHDLQGLDGGLVIHPGNRYGSGWYHEAVVPNTISDPIVDEGGNQLEVAIHSAAERLAERIVR